MSVQHNEAGVSGETRPLSVGENQRKPRYGKSSSAASGKSTNSDLPSSAGPSRKGGNRKGPAGPKREKRLGHDADLSQQVEEGRKRYEMTAVYVRGRDATYRTRAALDAFNRWVHQHVSDIDPREQRFCAECGEVDFEVCEHALLVVAEPPAPVAAAPTYKWAWHPWDQLKSLWITPNFAMGDQNSKDLAGFSNEHINDREMIVPLYNYITVNQQTNYLVNGRDDRELRLAHSLRLAHRWAEMDKSKDRLCSDTYYKNRFLFTVQRAADQGENSMLFGYTNPNRNFGLAWLPTSLLVRMLVLIVFSLMGIIIGRYVWPQLLPRLAELAVWHYMGTVRTLLLTLQAGSVQLLSSGLTIFIDLLAVPLLRVSWTLAFSVFSFIMDNVVMPSIGGGAVA